MTSKDIEQKLRQLNQREIEVLRLRCIPKSYEDIAAKLFLSVPTVKNTMGYVYIKLGLDKLELEAARLKALFTEYCPALENLTVRPESPESTKTAPIPEEIPPESVEPEHVPEEVIKMVEKDETAIVVWRPSPLELITSERESRPPIGRILLLIAGLLICVLLATNIVLFFSRAEPTPPVQSVIVRETVVITIPPTPVAVQSIASPSVPQVIVVTATPIPGTATVRSTNTPLVPTKTPTRSVTVLLQDDFTRDIRPEWRVTSGQYMVPQGKLQAAGYKEVTLEFGDNSLRDYTVEFDFTQFAHLITLTMAKKLRYHATPGLWEAFLNGQWTPIASGPGIPGEGRLRLTIKDNTYTTFLNGQPHFSLTYGAPISGPFSITVNGYATIAKFLMTSP